MKDTIHIPRPLNATDPVVLGALIGSYLHKFAKRFPGDELTLVTMAFESGEKLQIRFHNK